MSLNTGLDDLCVRFIVNLPASELSGFDRIGTHIEEAHWFYEDWIRKEYPSLPPMSPRNFSLRILLRCPLTAHCSPELLEKAYTLWIGYKKSIPVRGLILLNEAMDSVVLVRGTRDGSQWMFPRGKINQGEDDLDCAIREVAEETGFDAKEMGLIPANRKEIKSFDMMLRDQHIMLYVVPNVPMDYKFLTRTRNEIGDIRWYKLDDLPGRFKKKQSQENAAALNPTKNKFFLVAPFMEQLTRWIKHQTKKRDRSRHAHKHRPAGQVETEDALTEEEGMTTETAAEPTAAFATAESHEAATRELHRLLNIQPPTQTSQIQTPHSGQDNGQALLTMLRQTKDTSTQHRATGHPNSRLPHTPMDHVYNVAPEPRTPNHHHPAQTLPPDGYYAPPTFPIQTDMNDQLRSVLGLTSTAPLQATKQTTQVINHQVTVTTAPESATQPNLLHPQPLPRQANHILADAIVSMPPVPQNHHIPGTQQVNMPGSFTGVTQLPQQLVANFKQPPTTLDNNRLALLNAFKTGSGPARDTVIKAVPLEKPVADTHGMGREQPANLASLGSSYGPGTAAACSGPFEPQGNAPATQRSPHAPVSFRLQNISQNQQKALLDIFKQPATMPPSQLGVQPASKETAASRQVQAQQPLPGHQLEVGVKQPVLPNQSEILPYGARPLVTRPKQMNNPAYEHYNQKQALQNNSHIVDSLGVGGAAVENRIQPARVSNRDILLGSPYTNQAQLGLATSPGSLSSIPNLVPRHQEADPQQVQRLMSLFNKSAVASPDAAVGQIAGKGKEPALYDARLHQPGTHIASVTATPGMDGTGSAHSMSRRSSQQAPISPENEKFLLNYLNTVSSGAK